ncbi:hypothetical protein EC844_12632 [Acinetobacter calcoaceticus]|uniref:Uncharacterized protein n=1 Tax=Acinetobacter calcoaceticus TaxID=471 RepID=A0A4V2QZS1_ACICA|nr:hypothetical protein EC844_12632 [Acinetobacter calcoaceticus]
MLKIKQNLILITVLIITIGYLSLSFYFFFDSSDFVDLPLNEKGDFLAGAFAPLAFLWLVYGYYQQRQEIKQNTDALRLQADELANSVEQQKQILEISKSELELKHFEARPHLSFQGANFEISYETVVEYDDDSGQAIDADHVESVSILVNIKNQGGLAKSLTVCAIDHLEYSFEWDAYEISKNETTVMNFYLLGDELEFLKNNPKQDLNFDITYFDKYGRKYHERINMLIQPSRNCSGDFSVYIKKIPI